MRARLERAQISIQIPGKSLDSACLSRSTKFVCEESAPKPSPIQTMTKAQQLKEARDYSFLLSDDVEVPYAAQTTSEIPMSTWPDNEPKCVVSSSREIASKVATKPIPMQSPTIQKASSDPKKHVRSHGGNINVAKAGSGADGTAKKIASLKDKNERQNAYVGRPESVPQKETPIQKPPTLPKVPPKPMPKVQADKPVQKHVATKLVPKPAPKPAEKLLSKSISKPAPKPASKPAEKPSSKPSMKLAAEKPAPKMRAKYDDLEEDLDEGGDYRSLIRQMFGYNPKKYGHEDGDDRGMEVGFSSIQAEERRSARIAREEDERDLELIEAEERAQKARAKKRKLKNN
eukprot:Gb_17414 [translate_table: standard]